MLASARALYTSGNYPAARQMAEEVKSAHLGVDGQAEELLAQIGLAEQGGALSLYESALAAIRSGENIRARALLTEVAAAGASLDENLLAKVQELLKKLPADDKTGGPKGKAVVGEKSTVIPDAEALAAQKLNAEVGTKIAEARRLQETDPDKAIAIYQQTMKAVKASGLSPNLMRPDGPPPGSRHSSWPRRTRSPSRSRCRTRRARRDRAQAAADPRSRQGQEGTLEGVHGEGPVGLCRGQLRRVRGLRQASGRD